VRDAVGPPRPRVLVALLAVLLVVVLGTAAILVHDRREAAETEALRPAAIGNPGWQDEPAGRAVVAARTAAETYFSLDHQRVGADMDAMRALGTPEFVDAYDSGSRALAARIRRERLVLSAQLPPDGTATEYLVSDRARVLVSVDVTTTRDDADGEATATGTTRYRTRVALDLVDGAWLVSALDEVA
jgi:hypothetical protein